MSRRWIALQNLSDRTESMIVTKSFVLKKPGKNTIPMLAGYYDTGNGPNDQYMFDIYAGDKVKIVTMFKVLDDLSGYTLNYLNYSGEMFPIIEYE